MVSTNQKDYCDYTALSGFATFSWLASERRQLSTHLCNCEHCQMNAAMKLLEWEERLKPHRLPDAPATIARWRPVALYLCYAEIPPLHGEQGEAERAGQIDRKLGVRRWQEDLGGVEEAARSMWCLDAAQRERMQTWLEALEKLGDTIDCSDTGETEIPFGEEAS